MHRVHSISSLRDQQDESFEAETAEILHSGIVLTAYSMRGAKTEKTVMVLSPQEELVRLEYERKCEYSNEKFFFTFYKGKMTSVHWSQFNRM